MPPLWYHYATMTTLSLPKSLFLFFPSTFGLVFPRQIWGPAGNSSWLKHGKKKQLNPMCIFPITRMFRKCSSHLWIVNFFGLKRKVRPQFRRGISLLDFNLTRSQSLFRGENPHVWTKQSNLFPLIKYYGIIIWYYGYYTYIILLLDNPIYYPIPFWLSGKSRLILAG